MGFLKNLLGTGAKSILSSILSKELSNEVLENASYEELRDLYIKNMENISSVQGAGQHDYDLLVQESERNFNSEKMEYASAKELIKDQMSVALFLYRTYICDCSDAWDFYKYPLHFVMHFISFYLCRFGNTVKNNFEVVLYAANLAGTAMKQAYGPEIEKDKEKYESLIKNVLITRLVLNKDDREKNLNDFIEAMNDEEKARNLLIRMITVEKVTSELTNMMENKS